jgi:HIRAN domain
LALDKWLLHFCGSYPSTSAGARASDSQPTGRYEFVYLAGIRAIVGFEPLLAFPDFGRQYTSRTLFPFFANRLMSSRRSDYGPYLAGLSLHGQADDFEILSRSGGQRETDRFELFEEPTRDHLGNSTCAFFVRGLRYVAGAFEAAGALVPGEPLTLRLDPDPQDAAAVAVLQVGGARLGYVPQYASRFVSRAIMECDPESVSLAVEHVGDVYGMAKPQRATMIRARLVAVVRPDGR